MAEIIGVIASGVTLAALFTTCIEAFDLIHAGLKQEHDFNILKVKLEFQKCRLYIWGKQMGLTDMDSTQMRPIDSFHDPDLVRKGLEVIRDLFSDADKIESRYGCKEAPPQLGIEDQSSDAIRHLTLSFDSFRISNRGERSSTRKGIRKIAWAIHDRKKFGHFISEIREFIDCLKEVTSLISSQAHQEQIMKQKIGKIVHVRTLEVISEACEIDYPRISDAASTRAEALSTTKQSEIEHWSQETLETVESNEVGDLEALGVTEIKHRFYRLTEDFRTLSDRYEQLQKLDENAAGDRFPPRKRPRSNTLPETAVHPKRAASLRAPVDEMMSAMVTSTTVVFDAMASRNKGPRTAISISELLSESVPVAPSPCDKLQRELEAMVRQMITPTALFTRIGGEDIDAWTLMMNRQTHIGDTKFLCSACHQPLLQHSASSDYITACDSQLPATSGWFANCFLACIAQSHDNTSATEEYITAAAYEFQHMLTSKNPGLLTAVLTAMNILSMHDHNNIAERIMQASYQFCEENLPEGDPVGIIVKLWTTIATIEGLGSSNITHEVIADVQKLFLSQLGSFHPYTIAAKYAYSWLLKYEGHAIDSEIVLMETYETSCSVYGAIHMQSIFALASLAGAQVLQGKENEAISNFETVILNAGFVLGQNHPYTCEAKRRLAMLLIARDMAEGYDIPARQIERLYWEVLMGRVKMLGRSHDYTLVMRIEYEQLCRERGSWDERKTAVRHLFGENDIVIES